MLILYKNDRNVRFVLFTKTSIETKLALASVVVSSKISHIWSENVGFKFRNLRCINGLNYTCTQIIIVQIRLPNLALKTQSRHQQKSKTGASVSPKTHICPNKFKKNWSLNYHKPHWLSSRTLDWQTRDCWINSQWRQPSASFLSLKTFDADRKMLPTLYYSWKTRLFKDKFSYISFFMRYVEFPMGFCKMLILFHFDKHTGH